MSISISTRQAYSEVDEFLELLSDEQINKIPRKLREFFKEEKDQNYKKGIHPEYPIKNQDLKEETLGIIALLNLQYWCENENEKQRLKQVYAKNEEKYQKVLQEKYNVDNLFKKHSSSPKEEYTITNEVSMVEYKESILKKFVNKIKNIFHLG